MKKTIYSSILTLAIATSLTAPAFAASGVALKDISKSYAQNEIQALVNANIITGDGQGSFRPSDSMTRQEFAVVLAKTLSLPTNSQASAKFTDVSEWARPYVGALVEAGITSGVSQDKFGAKQTISREQLAVFFIRAMGYEDVAKNAKLDISFADASKVASYARDSVALASKIGFIKGTDSGFAPKDNAQRQAVARLAYELYQNKEVYINKVKEVVGPEITSVSSSQILLPSNEVIDGFKLNVDLKDSEGKVISKDKLPSDITITYSDSLGIFKSDGSIADKTKIPAIGTDVSVKVTVASASTTYSKEFTGTYKVTSNVTVFLKGANEIQLNFLEPVDSSKVKVTLTRGTTNTDISSVTYSADKKTASLKFNSKLYQGTYTINIVGVGPNAITKTLTVEAQRVEQIDIIGDIAALTTSGATLNYVVYDQYGNDITKDNGTPEITWTVSTGTATDNNKGLITLTGNYKIGDTLVITGIEMSSTKVVTKTIKVGNTSSVSLFENITLYNSANKTLETNSTFSDFILLFDAKDQYGNKVTNVSQLKNELIVMSTNPTVADIDVANLDNKLGANFDSIGIPLKSVNAGKDGTATITFLSKTTGSKATFDVVVKKSAIVDVITIQTPSEAVAVGEEVTIPFSAIDQYGVTVTDYKAFASTTDRVILNASAGSLKFVNDPATKKAVLKYTAPNVATPVVNLVVISPTGKNSNVTFEVKEASVPKTITNIVDFTSAVSIGADTKIQASNLKVQDQYGRVVKLDDSFFAKYKIKITATDGTANNVSISDSFIDSKTKQVSFVGAVKGNERITLEIFDIKANNVVTNTEYSFNVRVADVSEIVNYDVKDIATLYHDAEHSVELVVLGVLSDNTKVVISPTKYMVTSAFSGVTYVSGKLDASGVTFSANDQATKTGNITVVVEGNEGPVTLTKQVVVSNDAPKTKTISFEDTAKVTVSNGVAVVKATDTNMANLLSVFKGKDQYGVNINLASANISITNIVKSSGSTFEVANNGSSTISIANAQADDTFIVTMATLDGQVSTLKVIVVAN